MANQDSPFGFVPQRTTDGSDYHGKMRDFLIPAAVTEDTFIGDMMINGGLDDAETVDSKVPNLDVIAVASAASVIVGSVVELYPDFRDEGTLISNYRAGGTSRTAKVVAGSAVVHACQANADATLDGGDIGLAYDIDIATAVGDQITGVSGQQIDSNLLTTGQFLLRGFSDQVGNEVGVDYPIVLVSINDAEGGRL